MTKTTEAPAFEVKAAPLSEMKMWPRNPKEHDVGAITMSFEKFGYVAPILVNKENGVVLAGHGRIETLETALRSDDTPPNRIMDISEQGKPDWLVPYIEVSVDPDLHEAYVVTDNRLTQIGGWNEPLLIEVLMALKDQDLLEVTGYDGEDLDYLIQNHGIPAEAGTPVEGEEFPDLDLRFEISCVAENPGERDAIVKTLQNLGKTPEVKTLREVQ